MTDDSSPSLPDDLPEQLRSLVELVDQRQQAFDDLWPEVLHLRRTLFVDGGEAARTAMENAIREAGIARYELEAAIAAMVTASGIDPDELEGPLPPLQLRGNGSFAPRLGLAGTCSDAADR